MSRTSFPRSSCIHGPFLFSCPLSLALVVFFCDDNELELATAMSGPSDISQEISGLTQVCAVKRDTFDVCSSERRSVRTFKTKANPDWPPTFQLSDSCMVQFDPTFDESYRMITLWKTRISMRSAAGRSLLRLRCLPEELCSVSKGVQTEAIAEIRTDFASMLSPLWPLTTLI